MIVPLPRLKTGKLSDVKDLRGEKWLMATGVRRRDGLEVDGMPLDFSTNFLILSALSRAFDAFAFHCCLNLSDCVLDRLRWRKDSAALM